MLYVALKRISSKIHAFCLVLFNLKSILFNHLCVFEADKEIQALLEKKRFCHNRRLAKPDDQVAKAAYKTARSALQAKLRTMQNDWWTTLAERTQRYADMGDMLAFCEALKTVYRLSQQL